MILMIDNYDSFTYNLVQMLMGINQNVTVCRNDQIDVPEIEALRPSAIVISPGPGVPSGAGVSVAAVRHFGSRIPILGVCLGHQAIAEAFGGKVVKADRIMHGKASSIFHDGEAIYEGLGSPFEAIRYHSLIVDRDSLPRGLVVSAWTERREIMGLRHRRYPIEGVQFHPESFLTEAGRHIIQNFVQIHSENREEIRHD